MAAGAHVDSADVADKDGVKERGGSADPLGLFAKGPPEARAACVGQWRTEGLDVHVTYNGEPHGLVMEASSKEYALSQVSFNAWSAALVSTPEAEMYVLQVSGYGPATRLSLRPGAKHEGNSKTAVLQRREYVENGGANQNGARHVTLRSRANVGRANDPAAPGVKNDSRAGSAARGPAGEQANPQQPPPRRNSPGLLRSLSGSRSRGRGRNRPSCSASRSNYSSRSRSRSRRSGRRGGRGGGKAGGKGGKGKDGEEITTLFVTQLPDDATEKEIRRDMEKDGAIVERVVLMRRGGEVNAFVRFDKLADCQRAMDKVNSGRVKVCESKVKGEIARRNTN